MALQLTTLALFLIAITGFVMTRRRALAQGDGTRRNLHSQPKYHGYFVFLATLLPGLVFLGIFLLFKTPVVNWLTMNQLPAELRNQGSGALSLLFSRIEQHAAGGQTFGELPEGAQGAADFLAMARRAATWAIIPFALFPAALGFWFAQSRVQPTFRARNATEKIVRGLMIVCATLAVLTTFGIVMSVLFEAIRFFRMEPISEFLFSLEWNPGTAIREGQAAGADQGSFGIAPLFLGTLLIATIAMATAVPLGLLSAIYLAELAKPRVRKILKPMLEVLAGIPTVVYGVFAALTVSPFIINLGTSMGFDVGAKVALAAGIVMGFMLIPFISSLSDDAITAVPDKLRNGAYSMGATHGETITRVVLPAALPGLVGAVLLAVSRAIGETMIVLLAAGLRANLTFNPLDTTTTVTVQIANLLTGDQRFDSAKTLSAFALGLVLFLVTLALNVGALKFQQRYQEKYD
ncbi:phosphate ABC transporter permease [Roseivivax halodurans JCM 10272]|uniref:Phosphate transport system permease protein n=1 Tax=Roseivivax halodurans JCM 10272 TaxID=1449350 RepID=X7EA67_9RHOB|nr:phosphate ABC transporter permease subunit PstC [Roseivivax halodurans]ETX12832.1 phosphate ABC transporter permease [Roseivivax halodurans JCM 10272]